MGVYLSTANREVEMDEGSGLGLKYAAGGVQGWRKAMEGMHSGRLPSLVTRLPPPALTRPRTHLPTHPSPHPYQTRTLRNATCPVP